MASQLVALVSRAALTVVLAHLLVPTEFGLAGMVLVFSGLALILTDFGLSASLVQVDSLTEEDCSTSFWTGLVLSFVWVVVAVFVSPAIARFYGEPRVRWMLVVLSVAFVAAALSTTQAALLWRRMDFRALELRAMFATAGSTAIGIGAAVAGLGAWSLVVQAVSMTAVSTASIWVLSSWRPHFTFSLASLRRMSAFGARVFLARLLGYGDRNLDNILVGRFLGAASLGLYSIGYSVIMIPFERLLRPLENVIIPAFASVQNDLDRMRRLWLRGTRLGAALIFPMMTGAILVSHDAVAVVLGDRWLAAVPIVQLLAWVALVQSLSYLNGAVYQSLFRSGLLLRVAVAAFVLDGSSFAIGLHWGVAGVAAAYALANTVVLIPVNLVVVARLLEVGLAIVVAELRGVIEATVVMGGVVLTVRETLERVGVGAAPRLGTTIAAGLLTYLLMCYWRERRVFFELRPARRVPIGTELASP